MNSIEIKKIGITKLDTDVVVNAANTGLWKNANIVTDKGKELGLYNEVKVYPTNTYLAVAFGKKTQEFVVEHLEKIVNGEIVKYFYGRDLN